MLNNLEPPVSFSRLSEISGSKHNSIIVFNAFDRPYSYTAAVIRKGLLSGSVDTLIKNIDCLFKSGYHTDKSGVLSNVNVCLATAENRKLLGKLLLSSKENIELIKAASYLHH